jgi:DNA-binding CsgD family transcriptional regulator
MAGGMGISTEAVSKLLLTLYEAPGHPEKWSAFLKEFAGVLELPAVTILHQHFAQREYHFDLSSGIDPRAMELYDQHFGCLDPYWSKFQLAAEGDLVFGEQLCPTPQLRRTEFYNDFLATHDDVLGVYASVATINQPQSLQVMTVYRPVGEDSPIPHVAEVIKTVIPHVRCALRLQRHIDELARVSRNLALGFDAAGLAVLLLGERGNCLFASRHAEALLCQGNALLLQNGHLTAKRPAEAAALSVLIARVISTATNGGSAPAAPISVSRSAGTALRVSAIPLPRSAPLASIMGVGAAVAMIFIRDPDEESRSLSDALNVTYGLTRAESRVAGLLFEGRSIAAIAESIGVSRETVRGQLKAIFEKTGMRRQGQLVKLLSDLARTL